MESRSFRSRDALAGGSRDLHSEGRARRKCGGKAGKLDTKMERLKREGEEDEPARTGDDFRPLASVEMREETIRGARIPRETAISFAPPRPLLLHS